MDYRREDFPEATYVFTWGSIEAKAGGMTRAMLRQLNMLLEAGKKCIVLCCAKNIEQLDNPDYYRRNGFEMIGECNFFTITQYFECKFDIEGENERDCFPDILHLPKEEKGGEVLYYYNGELYAIGKKTNGRKQLVRLLDDRNGRVEILYWEGRVNRVAVYSKDRVSTNFYTKKGRCIMNTNARKNEKGEWREYDIKVFDYKEEKVIHFAEKNELIQFFFTQFIEEMPDDLVFVIHNPFLDFDPGFHNMHDNRRKILRIGINHGCGIGGNRMWYDNLNPRIRDMIEKKVSPDVEGFVCLTREAAEDFARRLGDRNIIYYIPNTVTIPGEIGKFENRNMKKIIFTGRLSAEKQIDHLIKAWKTVEQNIPDAILEINGDGDRKKELIKLSEELHLKNVIFNGYVDNPENHFSLAACSVTCSDFEGFSLSLHESLANGCPVITYDFKYGPKDIIQDGINGFTVQKNDINKLAEKIIFFLQLPSDKIKQMSEKAYKSVFNLKNENYKYNWIHFFNDVLRKYELNLYNTTIDCDLKNMIMEKDIYQIILHVKGEIPGCAWGKEQIRIRTYNSSKTDYVERVVVYQSNKENRSFIVDVKSSLADNSSICLIWNNCYYEKMIDELIGNKIT